MDIVGYNCNGHQDDHTNGGIKIEHTKHMEGGVAVGAMAMEGVDHGIGGGRLDYWTPLPGEGKNNNNINGTRGMDLQSMMYGDDLLLVPKVDLGIHQHHHVDVRSCWRDLTGASRTSSGTKAFGGVPFHGSNNVGGGGGGGQQQVKGMIGEKEYHGRVVKVDNEDGNEEGLGMTGNRQRWEEAATSEGEGEEIHHAQYNIQKGDLRMNPCQNGRDLEVLGIDTRRRSRQDINHYELDIDEERSKGSREHITYGECQKNQSAVRGVTSIDGCGEFLSSGKEEKLALTCAACGCHRNFHQRIVLFEGEEQELPKAKREKEEAGGNYFTSICDIDRVAHELMATANGAIALAQESLCYNEGRVREFSMEEQNIIAKISLENLDHIAKVINSTTECLKVLRKPSMFRKDSKSDCPHEGPSSSDASPVITVEKRAIQSILTPPSPARPFGPAGGPPLKNSITMFSDACAMHTCGSAPRKPLDRPIQKMKRTRTRISLEQREKLNAFAEKAGWTVVGQRKETIDAACQYIGIEPKTLKYWIHNSKQKWKRQPSQSDDTSK